MLFLGGQAMCSISLNPGRQELTEMLNWGHLLSPAVRALVNVLQSLAPKIAIFPFGQNSCVDGHVG